MFSRLHSSIMLAPLGIVWRCWGWLRHHALQTSSLMAERMWRLSMGPMASLRGLGSGGRAAATNGHGIVLRDTAGKSVTVAVGRALRCSVPRCGEDAADWCLYLPEGAESNLAAIRQVQRVLLYGPPRPYFFDCQAGVSKALAATSCLKVFGAPLQPPMPSLQTVGWLLPRPRDEADLDGERGCGVPATYLPISLGYRSSPLPDAVEPYSMARPDHTHSPQISVIIPMKDAAKLTGECIAAVRQGLSGQRVEFVLVDNGSESHAAQVLFRRMRSDGHVVVGAPGPFNFSRLVNAGVEAARGDVILLLNNDVICAEHAWSARLMSLAQFADVGCVGTRLDYPNGRIQHLGIALGFQGLAGHPFRGWSAAAYDALGYVAGPREVTGVTGAFMLLRKQVFNEVGGFDEALPTAFNDVDFCLKLRRHGYRNIVCTDVVHIHHESYSRGGDGPAGHAREQFLAADRLLRGRWGSDQYRDKFMSPAVLLADESMGLASPWHFNKELSRCLS